MVMRGEETGLSPDMHVKGENERCFTCSSDRTSDDDDDGLFLSDIKRLGIPLLFSCWTHNFTTSLIPSLSSFSACKSWFSKRRILSRVHFKVCLMKNVSKMLIVCLFQVNSWRMLLLLTEIWVHLRENDFCTFFSPLSQHDHANTNKMRWKLSDVAKKWKDDRHFN